MVFSLLNNCKRILFLVNLEETIQFFWAILWSWDFSFFGRQRRNWHTNRQAHAQPTNGVHRVMVPDRFHVSYDVVKWKVGKLLNYWHRSLKKKEKLAEEAKTFITSYCVKILQAHSLTTHTLLKKECVVSVSEEYVSVSICGWVWVCTWEWVWVWKFVCTCVSVCVCVDECVSVCM